MNQSYKNQNSKGKLGACPCLSLFRENSQWSDNSLRGTVRRGANWSSLPEGKICSRPEADDSLCRSSNDAKLENYYKTCCKILSKVIKEAKKIPFQ